VGFKDLLVYDIQQDILYSQNVPMSESVDISPLPAHSVEEEHRDPLMTAIIPMQGTSNVLVKTIPIQSIPTSLASFFHNLKKNWVLESILKDMEMIIDIISDHDFAKD